ncbi:hypothetical protein JXE04_01930 [Patescibacteria group bacterium]|nr:hypothetical protein [Patescibacteria group bacterium]
MPSIAHAAIEDPIVFQPQVGIPGFNTTTTLDERSTTYIGQLIQAFYNYGLSIGGILAAVVLMSGGLIWLTSAGSSDKISQAKNLMIGSITGLSLLFGAWIILNTINPNLINLKVADIKYIEKVTYCCDTKKGLVDKNENGQCTTGSLCDPGETCSNNGNNIFSCTNNEEYTCCVYNSNSITAGLQSICISIQEGSCPATTENFGGGKLKYTLENLYCGNRKTFGSDSCVASDCSKQEDGTNCGGPNDYCYSHTCYVGLGSAGEPCGNEEGSTCSTSSDCTSDWGWRRCSEGLTCCKDYGTW